MVPITYAKKLKNCFKLDPRCPKAEEVRYVALSLERTTANVLNCPKSSREIVIGFLGGGARRRGPHPSMLGLCSGARRAGPKPP